MLHLLLIWLEKTLGAKLRVIFKHELETEEASWTARRRAFGCLWLAVMLAAFSIAAGGVSLGIAYALGGTEDQVRERSSVIMFILAPLGVLAALVLSLVGTFRGFLPGTRPAGSAPENRPPAEKPQ